MMAKKITTSHRGRRCKYPKCNRVLSIYNHQTHCHIHLTKLSAQSSSKVSEK